VVRHFPPRHLAELFPRVQFSRDPETLNQYFREMTPNTGPSMWM